MNWFVKLCWFIGDIIHLGFLALSYTKECTDRFFNRYKFKIGDWVYAENTVGKIMDCGWKTYDVRLYCKDGVYRYTATQRMAERTYKKVDKHHFKAIATIYDS